MRGERKKKKPDLCPLLSFLFFLLTAGGGGGGGGAAAAGAPGPLLRTTRSAMSSPGVERESEGVVGAVGA